MSTEIYSSNYIGVLNSAVEYNITGQLADRFTGGTTNTYYPQYDVYLFFYDSSGTYQKAIIIDDSHIVEVTTYNVTFEEDGGSSIQDQILRSGDLVIAPQAPSMTGFDFGGWYRDSELKKVFIFTTPVPQI